MKWKPVRECRLGKKMAKFNLFDSNVKHTFGIVVQKLFSFQLVIIGHQSESKFKCIEIRNLNAIDSEFV